MTIINELKSTIANLKSSAAKEQDKMIDELHTLRSTVKDLENELTSARKLIESRDAVIKSNNLKIEDLTQEADILKSKIFGNNKDHSSEKKSILTQLDEANKAKDILKNQLSELNAQLAQMNQKELSKDELTNIKIQNLRDDIKSLESQNQSLQATVNDLEQQMRGIKIDYDAKTKQLIEDHSISISQKDAKIDEIQSELRMLGQKLASSNKDQNQLDHKLVSKDTLISRLQNENDALQKEIQSLTDRIRLMLGEIDQKQNIIDKKDSDINDKISLLNNKEKEFIDKLGLKQSEYESQLKLTQDELEQQRAKMQDMLKGGDMLKQLEYEITMTKKAHAEELDKLKQTIEREVKSKIESEKKYRAQIESLEKQITILNKDIIGKNEEVQKLSKDVDKQKNYNQMFKDDIEQLRSEVKKYKNDLEASKTALEANKSELEIIKQKYQNMPDIDLEEIKLKEKIASMKEAKINALLTKMDHVMGSFEANLS